MRKLILLFTAMAIAGSDADSQDFLWAGQMKGTGNTSGTSLAVGASGDIYVAGSFGGTTDFHPGPYLFDLTALGEFDIFVMKLDAGGNFLWAKRIGATGDDYAEAIVLDAFENIYITGTFIGNVDFDPGPGSFNLTSIGGYNSFVCKLDAAGNFVRAEQTGGSVIVFGSDLTLDEMGNVYTTGQFQGTADFDPGAGIFNLHSLGNFDVYIRKSDTDGNLIWVRQIGGVAHIYSRSISVDALGNVYTTGRFQGTVDFDPGPAEFNLTAIGNYDIFISKLDSSGNFVWAKQMGGAGADFGGSVVDASGNVYTTGRFRETADFDPGAGEYYFQSSGGFDAFISRLGPSGNLIWARQISGPADIYSNSISVDATGSIYAVGRFGATADFGPEPEEIHLTSSGNSDIFICKLDSSGNFLWVKQMDGTDRGSPNHLTLDASGHIYTTGWFSGTVDFDPDTSAVFSLTATGLADGFVSKLPQISTNVDEVAAGPGISIYPIPARSFINIEADQSLIGSTYSISDQLGRTISSGKLAHTTTTLPLEGMPRGMYVLHIKGRRTYVVKLLKM